MLSEQIGLSLKRLLTNPWIRLARSVNVGQFARGTITRAEFFGTFVDLSDGVECLLHTSDLAKADVGAADLAPSPAATVSVRTIAEKKRQIDLQFE